MAKKYSIFFSIIFYFYFSENNNYFLTTCTTQITTHVKKTHKSHTRCISLSIKGNSYLTWTYKPWKQPLNWHHCHYIRNKMKLGCLHYGIITPGPQTCKRVLFNMVSENKNWMDLVFSSIISYLTSTDQFSNHKL